MLRPSHRLSLSVIEKAPLAKVVGISLCQQVFFFLSDMAESASMTDLSV